MFEEKEKNTLESTFVIKDGMIGTHRAPRAKREKEQACLPAHNVRLVHRQVARRVRKTRLPHCQLGLLSLKG